MRFCEGQDALYVEYVDRFGVASISGPCSPFEQLESL